MPSTIDQVASVTRKGWSFRNEITSALATPTQKPTARMSASQGIRSIPGRSARVADMAEARLSVPPTRKVDAAAHDDDGLAGRHEDQDHRRGADQRQLVEAERTGPHDLDDARYHDEHHQRHAPAARPTRECENRMSHAATWLAMVALRMLSSESSAADRVVETRP